MFRLNHSLEAGKLARVGLQWPNLPSENVNALRVSVGRIACTKSIVAFWFHFAIRRAGSAPNAVAPEHA